jgi:hypothetical protein
VRNIRGAGREDADGQDVGEVIDAKVA